jgi:hypothetical protein
MVESLRQSDPSQQLTSPSLSPGRALQFGRNQNVLERGEGREELKILEDEPDILITDTSAAIFVESPQIVTCQPNHTAGGII